MSRRPFRGGSPEQHSDDEMLGEEGTGFETPGRFKRTMRWLGLEKYGPARVPAHADIDGDAALGPAAAPNRFARAAGRVRAASAEEAGHRGTQQPKTTIAEAPARADGAIQDITWVESWLNRLAVTVLPNCRVMVEDAHRNVRHLHDEMRMLSASQHGYVGSPWLVVAVVAAVSIFDAFIVHSALGRAGIDTVALWGTTLTVPLVIAAANHAFGVVAGAIAVRLPAERVRLAVLAFVTGTGALVVTFVALAIFRHQSVKAQNDSLAAIAGGDTSQKLDFFLSPLWMGPLQIAGSIAAIAIVALWTSGAVGREVRRRLDKANDDLADEQAKLDRAEAEAEAAHQELRRARMLPFEIRAAAAAAEVDIETTDAVTASKVVQEAARADAMQAYYEAEFISTDKIYENGAVWRCAMPTDDRLLSRRVTPPPTVKSSEPDESPNEGGR